jgi:hypothetical protein
MFHKMFRTIFRTTFRNTPHHSNRLPTVIGLVIGAALLLTPSGMQAQHGGGGGGRGGGGGMAGGGGGAIGGRPDGVSDKDELKEFHRAMEVQATPEQRAAFAKIAQYSQAAGEQLQSFRESLKKVSASSPISEQTSALDEAIASARGGNQNFLTSFSSKQKSGLQDLTKKLAKADSELDREIRILDQIAQAPKPDAAQVSASAASLEKALASFQDEQLTLGREMSILFDAASHDVTFSLRPVMNSISVNGQTISIPATGAVSRTSAAAPTGSSAANGNNLFHLTLVADLSDLQQNATVLLRSGFRSSGCGERIEILEATLTPLAPASLVVAKVHFERWVCPPGQGSPMEVSSGDAAIDIKITPSLETTAVGSAESGANVHLDSEITRVVAQGFLGNSLRSGDLGVTVREQIAETLLSTLQKGINLKGSLPPVAQGLATVQKAQFQEAGPHELTLVLEGQLQLSEVQTQQFAAQIKQSLNAKGTTPP